MEKLGRKLNYIAGGNFYCTILLTIIFIIRDTVTRNRGAISFQYYIGENYEKICTNIHPTIHPTSTRFVKINLALEIAPQALTTFSKGTKMEENRLERKTGVRMRGTGTGRAICIVLDAFLTIGLMDDGCCASLRHVDRVLEK